MYETTLPVGHDPRSLRTDARRRAPASSSTATSSSPSARSGSSSAASSSTCSATRRSSAARARRARAERSSSTGPSSTRGPRCWAVANAEAAEMTKLAETTYRDVNIAYANELARFAARHGIDVTEVIGAANSQPYSHIHQPGVGVGGHCIPVYPHFLFNGEPDLRIPPLAREINESMAPIRRRHRRGPHRLARRPAGARARHRLPRRRARGRLQLRLPPPRRARAAGARVHGHDPYFDAEHLRELGFEPYDLGPGVPGPRRHPPGRARGLPVISTRPPCPASSSSWTGGTRSSASRSRRRRPVCRHRPLTWRPDCPSVGLAAGRGVWVVLPTYNERENLERIATRSSPPARGSLLIVDDALARRDRRAGRHARRARAARLGPAPPGQGGAGRRLPRRLPLGPRATRTRGRWSRWTPTSATTRRTCRASSRR